MAVDFLVPHAHRDDTTFRHDGVRVHLLVEFPDSAARVTIDRLPGAPIKENDFCAMVVVFASSEP